MTNAKKDVNAAQPGRETLEKAVWEMPKMAVLQIPNTELFENFGIDFSSFS